MESSRAWMEKGIHDLLTLTAQGEQEAFIALYDKMVGVNMNGPLVRRIRSRFSSLDDTQIENIVQHTMLKVFEKAHQYTGQTDNRAQSWVWRIAFNKGIDTVNVKEIVEDVETVFYYVNDDGNTENSEESCIENEDWEQFLTSLSSRQKQVVTLLSQGYEREEIAKMLEISAPRVSQLLTEILGKMGKGGRGHSKQ
jgi:RNA polymerase sigma factor (sigma-70 family)